MARRSNPYTRTRREIITFWFGLITAVSAGAWTVFTYFDREHTASANRTSAFGGATINANQSMVADEIHNSSMNVGSK